MKLAANPLSARHQIAALRLRISPAPYKTRIGRPLAEVKNPKSGGRESETLVQANRTLTVVSGNYQYGWADAPLAEPVVFEVRDLSGVPLPGAAVRYRVISGGGQVDVGEATCDGQGRAGVNRTAGAGLDPLLQPSCPAKSRLPAETHPVIQPPRLILTIGGP